MKNIATHYKDDEFGFDDFLIQEFPNTTYLVSIWNSRFGIWMTVGVFEDISDYCKY